MWANDITIKEECPDTISHAEKISELPEVVVESRRFRILHILAYVREYSSMSTYTDTISLFREKMVDYMIPNDNKVKFKGWVTPRILTCRSYYRFTNREGLDSVSDTSHHHFSWADWMGLAPAVSLPLGLRNTYVAADTVRGKYSATEIWNRIDDRVSIDVDVLSDTTSRKWVPNLAGFFRQNLDYEKFKVRYNYENIVGDTLTALGLTGYNFDIESRGRGHQMFRFNKINEPFFVNTNAEVYILDKEYISVKEANKWAKRNFDIEEIGIFEPLDAPQLSSSTLSLIERVEDIDKDMVRLDFQADNRMISKHLASRNFRIGNRALSLLKQATGISMFKSRRNFNKKWEQFKQNQFQRNMEIY